MTSLRQIEANRRNARLSTGPTSEEGKKRSRRNALRHGLAAETVVEAFEDAEDYAAFEMTIKVDYEPQTAVERELVLRLASLLWRLRRATTIESGLFKMEARDLLRFRQTRKLHRSHLKIINCINRSAMADGDATECDKNEPRSPPFWEQVDGSDGLTHAFIRLASLSTYPLDRLNRYEARLWRQARQILLMLECWDRRRPWKRAKFRA